MSVPVASRPGRLALVLAWLFGLLAASPAPAALITYQFTAAVREHRDDIFAAPDPRLDNLAIGQVLTGSFTFNTDPAALFSTSTDTFACCPFVGQQIRRWRLNHDFVNPRPPGGFTLTGGSFTFAINPLEPLFFEVTNGVGALDGFPVADEFEVEAHELGTVQVNFFLRDAAGAALASSNFPGLLDLAPFTDEPDNDVAQVSIFEVTGTPPRTSIKRVHMDLTSLCREDLCAPVQAPAPATLALVGLGLAGVAAAARRRVGPR